MQDATRSVDSEVQTSPCQALRLLALLRTTSCTLVVSQPAHTVLLLERTSSTNPPLYCIQLAVLDIDVTYSWKGCRNHFAVPALKEETHSAGKQ